MTDTLTLDLSHHPVVRVTAKWLQPKGRGEQYAVWSLTITCPFCGRHHYHGGDSGPTPLLGMRNAHCIDNHGETRKYLLADAADPAIDWPAEDAHVQLRQLYAEWRRLADIVRPAHQPPRRSKRWRAAAERLEALDAVFARVTVTGGTAR